MAAEAIDDGRLPAMCGLFKDRCDTLVVLADWIARFHLPVQISDEDRARFLTPEIAPAIQSLADKLAQCEWTQAAISSVIKEVLAEKGLKMPGLAMPVRVLVLGTPQTPSLDAVLSLQRREKNLQSLQKL